MSAVRVDYTALEGAAAALETAGTAVDSAGGSAPSGVDAGDATYIVTGLLAQVASSAAGLSEGLRAAGSKLRTDLAGYRDVDASAQQGLSLPGGPR
jgi:hypothetical protein